MAKDSTKENLFNKTTFLNILLSESISIIETPYGLNGNADNKIIRKYKDMAFTKFIHEGVYVEVIFDRDNNSLNYQIKTFDDKQFYKHSESPIKIKNMFSLFGKLLYVFKQIDNLLHIDRFYLTSFSNEKQVEHLYQTFVKSKQLKELMKSIGFNYVKTKKPSIISKVMSSGEVSNEHWFEKIR